MERNYSVNKNILRIIRNEDKKQSAVADRAGIRRDVFSRIIHCRRPVYADEVMPIATALGIPMEKLFEEGEGA
jgi:transcriptional regulator with XRE-family HTH domain